MDQYVPEFQGAYLEDSYLLGVVCEGRNIHLDVALALTLDHPKYAPPEAGEQHCYRRGRLVIGEPSAIELKAGVNPKVFRDPDGTLDLGSIELYRKPSGSIRIVTEWFELSAEAKSLSVSILGNIR